MKHQHSHATYHVRKHRKGHKLSVRHADGTKESVKYQTREDAKRNLHAHVSDHLRQGNKAVKLREAAKQAASMPKPKDKSKLRKTIAKSDIAVEHKRMAAYHMRRGEHAKAKKHLMLARDAARFRDPKAKVPAVMPPEEYARKSMGKPAKSYHTPTSTYHVHAMGDGYMFMHHPVGGKPEMSMARYRSVDEAVHGIQRHAAQAAGKRSAHDLAVLRGDRMKSTKKPSLKKSVKKPVSKPMKKAAPAPDLKKADTCKRCGAELQNTGKDTHLGGMCPSCAKKVKAKKSMSNDQILANRISKAGLIGQEKDRFIEPKLVAGTVQGEIMKAIHLAVDLTEAEHRVLLKSQCPAHAYGFASSAGGIEAAGTMGLTVCNCDKPLHKSDLAERAAKKLKEMRENVAALKMAQEMGIPVTDSSWLQNLLVDEE